MATDWKWEMLLFATNAANTQANRNIIADVFTDNDSGELVENERLAFENASRLALTSAPTVSVARAISSSVKKNMRDELEIAIDLINLGLSNQNKLVWYLIASVDLQNFDKGQLIRSSESSVDNRIKTAFDWQDALSDLELVVIEDE